MLRRRLLRQQAGGRGLREEVLGHDGDELRDAVHVHHGEPCVSQNKKTGTREE